MVMGIINVNEDSFFSDSRATNLNDITNKFQAYLEQGASIVDLGFTSTRPGASLSDAKDEIERLIPVLRHVRKEFPHSIISIDTYHASVAEVAANEGVSIINDISGGSIDTQMFATVAKFKIPYILMHIQGTPATMQKNPIYEDVVSEVLTTLATKLKFLFSLGCSDVILDPGFGFGKTLENNFELLKGLHRFTELNVPVLAGLSRKSMVNKVLDLGPEDALNGTTALNMIALLQGASILRVHDVKEAVQCVKLFQAYSQAGT
jgi:dihydropteroate synthase